MTNKVRVNLYLDRTVKDRAMAALNAIDSNLSEFVEDQLRSNLPMLEIAAETGDPQKVAQVGQSELMKALSDQFFEMGEFMRTIQETANGEEEVAK